MRWEYTKGYGLLGGRYTDYYNKLRNWEWALISYV